MRKYIQSLINFSRKNKLIPKLVSILLAAVLWGYISSSKTGTAEFKSQISYKGLEDGLVVSKIMPKSVTVEVKGRKDDLKNVNSRNVRAVIDLTTAESGVLQIYRVEYQKIDLQDDFDIQLEPPEVKALVEKKITRNVRILPRYSGTAAKGFMVGRIRLSPEYVRITGPGSVINSMGVVYTDKIPADGRNITFRQDIKIEKINEEILEYNISKVSANVPVLVNQKVSSFDIPVVLRNKKPGLKYLVSSDRVQVNVIVPENRKLDGNSFTAFIDVAETDYQHDEFVQKRKVEIMGFVHVTAINPDDENVILSTNPDSLDVIITTE